MYINISTIFHYIIALVIKYSQNFFLMFFVNNYLHLFDPKYSKK